MARTLKAGLRAAGRFGGFTLRRGEVNGQPGALVLDGAGRLIAVLILDIADGRIQAVRAGGARETFGADVVIGGLVELQ